MTRLMGLFMATSPLVLGRAQHSARKIRRRPTDPSQRTALHQPASSGARQRPSVPLLGGPLRFWMLPKV